MSGPLRVIPLILAVFWMAVPGVAAAQELMISEQGRETWQAVGRVNVGGFRSRSLCTGTLIAPTRVLTAAHCVVDPATGKPFPLYRVNFVAAWHKGAHRGTAKAAGIHVHPDYPRVVRKRTAALSPADIAYDLAVIVLDSALDEVAPAAVARGEAADAPVAVLGYRRDRPEILSDHLGCAISAAGGTLLRLNCPVVQGTSGAPVWQKTSAGDWQVVGVVSARNPAGGVAVGVTYDSLQAARLLDE